MNPSEKTIQNQFHLLESWRTSFPVLAGAIRLEAEETDLYRPHGTDTLTIGPQLKWLMIQRFVRSAQAIYIEVHSPELELHPEQERFTRLLSAFGEFPLQLVSHFSKLGLQPRVGSAVRTTATAERLDSELERAIVDEFASVPGVARIYSDRFQAEYVFTVVTKGAAYNDELMDVLLDHEIEFMQAFPSVPITVHYLPYSESHPDFLVRSGARLIFEG